MCIYIKYLISNILYQISYIKYHIHCMYKCIHLLYQLRAKSIVLMNTNRTFIILLSWLRKKQLTTSPFVEGRKGSLGEISLRTSKDSTSTSTPPDQTSILPRRLIVTIRTCVHRGVTIFLRTSFDHTPCHDDCLSTQGLNEIGPLPWVTCQLNRPRVVTQGNECYVNSLTKQPKFCLAQYNTYNCLNLFFLVHPQSVTVSPRLLSVSSPQRWLL